MTATPTRHSRRRIGTALLVLFVLIAGIGGALMIRAGLSRTPAAHAQPLPAHPFDIGSQAHPTQQLPLPKMPSDHVLIPSLGIDAPLDPVTRDGADLQIPTDVHHVGRFTGGAPVISKAGTTLLAGHVDNYDQGPGAFYPLHDIAPNATVYVSDSHATVTAWRVVSLQVVAKNEIPGGLFDARGPRRLALVTCGGPLDHSSSGNSYRDNVVVTAVPA
jgi:Sortase domain